MTEPSDRLPQASYSTAEVARRLGVSIPTVQRWVDLGHLKAWKTVGGHRRIDAESVEHFLADPHLAGGGRTAPDVVAKDAPTVLIVEDDPGDRDLLAELVKAALPAARVQLAESGFEALVVIGKAVPDVLVTDIAMPHMDGFQMLRHLSFSSSQRPPVILAVSGRTPGQFARLGPLPPDVRFVPKPIEPAAFVDTLRAAVAKASGAARRPGQKSR